MVDSMKEFEMRNYKHNPQRISVETRKPLAMKLKIMYDEKMEVGREHIENLQAKLFKDNERPREVERKYYYLTTPILTIVIITITAATLITLKCKSEPKAEVAFTQKDLQNQLNNK